ncbi:hypothetical protein BVG79_01521 [Ketogulonicigenium robustum]|uniref:DUF1800 domain-containing protein n=1 Tax=Ketogulonicigenium robustum TaxID=92947 RepID=A0A1W6P0R7_9RHOB|nr:DUF1800 domain-containing protein [Ketogulonicigenium robustum]ARO14867.1 hypothetical protein BVG79_01521 [Ketogulonicigenium robustum]
MDTQPAVTAPKSGDLGPISAQHWGAAQAAHLLERAGFGGTPADIDTLAAMTPEAAVDHLIRGGDTSALPAFDESDIWDPTLLNFPVSRPAATALAEQTGWAMGVAVKPGGARPLQPVTDRFFYWLRATVLETHRLAFWWMDRMVRSPHPLQEKMTLFWHGHFATSEEKLRDYRKIRLQLDTLRAGALGNFGALLTAVSKDPAMLVFLDAAQNVKGAPNENFGREVMELFTMGVGNYTEDDIREAARAFTGWGNNDLTFVFDPDSHDAGEKTFLGHTGHFDGDDILRIILAQDQTAIYIASKIYRFFVRDDLSSDVAQRLGALLRAGGYAIAPFLRTLFLSQDFYSTASVGTHIKSPTELIVSTYRKLGLSHLPGIPDPGVVGKTLGQVLLYPPTVAGWGEGRSWITPGLLFERGNFAQDVLFPDMISFSDPQLNPGGEVRRVNANINAGMEITAVTLEDGAAPSSTAGLRETFNTRYASLQGWQQAMRRVKPIPRDAAAFSLTAMVLDAGGRTTGAAVDALAARFLRVPLPASVRDALVTLLNDELGTSDLAIAQSYLEQPLRLVAHGIMSAPQYQLA